MSKNCQRMVRQVWAGIRIKKTPPHVGSALGGWKAMRLIRVFLLSCGRVGDAPLCVPSDFASYAGRAGARPLQPHKIRNTP